MNDMAVVEALLFVAGDDGLSIEELSKLTDTALDKLNVIIAQLIDKYNQDEQSGLTVIKTAHKLQLVTKSKYVEFVKIYAQSPYSQTLSRALLETLAIIAYRQPITRIEIEEIRGVQVANNLQKLRSRQLIKEVGRIDKPGRPLLYGTTDFFLDYFGMNIIDDLPELTEEESEQEITDLFSKKFHQPFEEMEKESESKT